VGRGHPVGHLGAPGAETWVGQKPTWVGQKPTWGGQKPTWGVPPKPCPGGVSSGRGAPDTGSTVTPAESWQAEHSSSDGSHAEWMQAHSREAQRDGAGAGGAVVVAQVDVGDDADGVSAAVAAGPPGGPAQHHLVSKRSRLEVAVHCHHVSPTTHGMAWHGMAWHGMPPHRTAFILGLCIASSSRLLGFFTTVVGGLCTQASRLCTCSMQLLQYWLRVCAQNESSPLSSAFCCVCLTEALPGFILMPDNVSSVSSPIHLSIPSTATTCALPLAC
jgi:hypothetical protein